MRHTFNCRHSNMLKTANIKFPSHIVMPKAITVHEKQQILTENERKIEQNEPITQTSLTEWARKHLGLAKAPNRTIISRLLFYNFTYTNLPPGRQRWWRQHVQYSGRAKISCCRTLYYGAPCKNWSEREKCFHRNSERDEAL